MSRPSGGTPSPVTVASGRGEGSYAYPVVPAGWPALPVSTAWSRKPEFYGNVCRRSLDVKPEEQSYAAPDGRSIINPCMCLLRIPDPGTSSFFATGYASRPALRRERLQLAGEAVPIAEQVASIQRPGVFTPCPKTARWRTGPGLPKRSESAALMVRSCRERQLLLPPSLRVPPR